VFINSSLKQLLQINRSSKIAFNTKKCNRDFYYLGTLSLPKGGLGKAGKSCLPFIIGPSLFCGNRGGLPGLLRLSIIIAIPPKLR
jgi:hypothetical protein